VATITIDSELHRCEARAHDWVLGFGVDVSVFRDQEPVALVRILCPSDLEEYEALAALSETDRVQLALDRFASGRLDVTPTSLLQAQQRIKSASGSSVVAVIASMQVRSNKPS